MVKTPDMLSSCQDAWDLFILSMYFNTRQPSTTVMVSFASMKFPKCPSSGTLRSFYI